MAIGSGGIGDSSSPETGDQDGLSSSPESEPDLALTSELEGPEADRISTPPEPQEPELAPDDEPENGPEGEGSTPPEEPDSPEEDRAREPEPRHDRSIGPNASPFDRLRDAFNEAHDQDVGGPDKASDPFGDVPIARVRSEEFRRFEERCKTHAYMHAVSKRQKPRTGYES